jgi:opacity protein-like surface antigen
MTCMAQRTIIDQTAFRWSSGLLFAVLSVSSAHATQCGPGTGDQDDSPVTFGIATGAGAAVNSLISVTNTINTAILSQGSSAFVSSPSSPTPDQQGGGVWTRGVVGTVTTSHNTNITVNDAGPGPVDVPEQTQCSTKIRQTFAGVQVGADFARLNWGGLGSSLHLGLTSGYAESQATEVNGSFSGNFQIPFIGMYAVMTNGNFFGDAQVRGDFYQNQINDAAGAIFNQKFNAQGISVAGNGGYHVELGNSWFLEPSLGVVWSRVTVDDLNFSGTQVLLGPTFGNTFPGSAHIGSIESVIGRATARIGTTFNAGNVVYQPFFAATVYHEFMGDVTSTLHFDNNFLRPPPACAGIECAFNVTMVTTRVQTFGQFGLGASASIADTGWLGYLRTDYRTGTDIHGVSLSGGLRYQYDPGKVAAPKKIIAKAPIPSMRPYNWAGTYVGGFIGAIWGDANWAYQSIPAFANGANTRTTLAGIAAGGTLGYNMQIDSWVTGLEADISWTNAGGGKSSPCPSGFMFTCQASMDWLSTVTGRLGYAFNRLLVYTKGGLAIGEMTARSVFNPGTLILAPGQIAPSATVFSGTNTAVGWTFGGGFEFAVARDWSAKAELMYFDLGQKAYQLDAPVNVAGTGVIGRVGVNYHLN